MRQGLRIVVRGRVQGVGFRDFTRRAALNLGLAGWVRNRPDGAVELEVSGDVVAIEAFKEHLRQGPPRSVVEELVEQPLPQPDGLPQPASFDIVFR